MVAAAVMIRRRAAPGYSDLKSVQVVTATSTPTVPSAEGQCSGPLGRGAAAAAAGDCRTQAAGTQAEILLSPATECQWHWQLPVTVLVAAGYILPASYGPGVTIMMTSTSSIHRHSSSESTCSPLAGRPGPASY